MTKLEQLIHSMPPHDPEAVPVDAAKAVLRDFVEPVAGVEQSALSEALGRVLAGDLVSPIDVPGQDNSAMDGWAVRSQDAGTGAPLIQIGSSYAGRPFTGVLGPGQCVRVMTGALVPRGADAVVVQEQARVQGERISLPSAQPGQNIRRAGEDLRKGAVALAQGTLLRPAEIGLVASFGIAKVVLTRRPRVAFFSTGDELRSFEGSAPAGTLGAGELFDSNRYVLAAMLRRLGCDTVDLGVVRDDPVALEAALRQAASDADAVITTGGVSEGDADFTRRMMERLAEVIFWKLAMRPGRPFSFGRFHGEASPYLFGLPGNPVAAMVTFYQFVRPALLALMGCRHCELPLARVKSQCVMQKKPGRTEYQRGVIECIEGEWTVRLTGPQGSGILRSMAQANCLVHLRPGQGRVEPGEFVDVMVMDGLV